jgi:hypothetical protein
MFCSVRVRHRLSVVPTVRVLVQLRWMIRYGTWHDANYFKDWAFDAAISWRKIFTPPKALYYEQSECMGNEIEPMRPPLFSWFYQRSWGYGFFSYLFQYVRDPLPFIGQSSVYKRTVFTRSFCHDVGPAKYCSIVFLRGLLFDFGFLFQFVVYFHSFVSFRYVSILGSSSLLS